MVLLDTCSFLWLVSDPDQIGAEARKWIVRQADSLFLSSISAFEIAMMVDRGCLELPFDLKSWFEKALGYHGVSEVPVTSEIAILSTRLPPLHRDPCDRMIIATSQVHDLTLLTPDPLIQRYPNVRVVW